MLLLSGPTFPVTLPSVYLFSSGPTTQPNRKAANLCWLRSDGAGAETEVMHWLYCLGSAVSEKNQCWQLQRVTAKCSSYFSRHSNRAQRSVYFGERMKALLSTSDIGLRVIWRTWGKPSPPWKHALPLVDLTLCEIKKGDLLPCEARPKQYSTLPRTTVLPPFLQTAQPSGVECAFIAGPDTRSFFCHASPRCFPQS